MVSPELPGAENSRGKVGDRYGVPGTPKVGDRYGVPRNSATQAAHAPLPEKDEMMNFVAALRRIETGAIPKCGHVALVLDCYYVDICVIFSSSGSLRMRLISQFSRASGARFSETDDSPETVVGRWILPAKLKALLGSSAILSQVVPGKDLMAESKSPLFGIAPDRNKDGESFTAGRFLRNKTKYKTEFSLIFSNKTENKTALARRSEQDDRIETNRLGSLKALGIGSDNLLGPSQEQLTA